ncbi:SatD family protein [Cellulophaga sp. Z1A5H]|uniref:SatD family protein n=1 Tax=Cellulophaga sp. Z1A5H TaxID=2687291 RepID=UPI0013FDA39F|nr:SatD family protein [Cellulophaga sp. Z1A5H]
MIAVLTGDIVNSEHYKASEWMVVLKKHLSKIGDAPQDWDIFRGDEFQLKVSVADALKIAILTKAKIKTIKGLDVRMGIGLGEETFVGTKISESNGSAYHFSGRIFETLKEQKIKLALAAADEKLEKILNLILKLALDFMDDWSVVSAEIVTISLENPNLQQQEIADQLGIKQSAVSQRQKRARLDLVLEVLTFYKDIIKQA